MGIGSFFCISALWGGVKPKSEQFIRVSKESPAYLEYEDADAFVAVGYNVCFPRYWNGKDDVAAFADMETHFKELAANGGNFARLWLSNGFYEIEDERAGVYNPAKFERIDKTVALAKKYGIRLKLCLEHFRGFGKFEGNAMDANIKRTAFINRKAYDGMFKDMTEYFESEKGRELFLNRFKALAARYADEPTVAAWELWNEINCVNAPLPVVAVWQSEMLKAVKAACPKQIALNSYGSLCSDWTVNGYKALAPDPLNEIAQVHRYLDEGAPDKICQGPCDIFAADAVLQIMKIAPNRPALLAETGAVEPGHAGPFRFYKDDKEGVIFHDLFFTPYFCGAAGSGQMWHWDVYVMANKLWRHIGAFTKLTGGIDPIKEDLKPMRADTANARVYALKGKTALIAFVRDSKSDWRTEFLDKKAPAAIKGEIVDFTGVLKGRKLVKAEFVNLWTGELRALPPSAKVELPDFTRSAGLRLYFE